MATAEKLQLGVVNLAFDPGYSNWVWIPRGAAGAISPVREGGSDHECHHADDGHHHHDELGVLPQIVHVPTGHIFLPLMTLLLGGFTERTQALRLTQQP